MHLATRRQVRGRQDSGARLTLWGWVVGGQALRGGIHTSSLVVVSLGDTTFCRAHAFAQQFTTLTAAHLDADARHPLARQQRPLCGRLRSRGGAGASGVTHGHVNNTRHGIKQQMLAWCHPITAAWCHPLTSIMPGPPPAAPQRSRCGTCQIQSSGTQVRGTYPNVHEPAASTPSTWGASCMRCAHLTTWCSPAGWPRPAPGALHAPSAGCPA